MGNYRSLDPGEDRQTKAQYYKKVAFFGLITIQVTIGIVYKFSQVGGKYTYSPASALVVAEFMKMAISVVMMFNAADTNDYRLFSFFGFVLLDG